MNKTIVILILTKVASELNQSVNLTISLDASNLTEFNIIQPTALSYEGYRPVAANPSNSTLTIVTNRLKWPDLSYMDCDHLGLKGELETQ